MYEVPEYLVRCMHVYYCFALLTLRAGRSHRFMSGQTADRDREANQQQPHQPSAARLNVIVSAQSPSSALKWYYEHACCL
jgi:hypothetical protein